LCCLLVLTHIGLTSSHLNRVPPTLLDLLLITLISLLQFLLILLMLSFLSSPIPELLLLSPYLLSPLKLILLITTPVYCLISLRSLFKHFSQKYNDSTLIEKMFHTLKDRSLDEVIIKKYDNSKKMDQECRAIDRLNQQGIPTSVHASEIIATTQAPSSIVFFAQKGPVKDLFSSTIKGTAAGVSFVRAVATLHQKGIGHGDIKPQNALSTPEGTKLIDFESSLHSQDIIVFTWGYIPPQMFEFKSRGFKLLSSYPFDKHTQPQSFNLKNLEIDGLNLVRDKWLHQQADRCKIHLHDSYALGVAISKMYLEDNDASLSIPLEIIEPLLAHLPWIQEKTNTFIRPFGQQELLFSGNLAAVNTVKNLVNVLPDICSQLERSLSSQAIKDFLEYNLYFCSKTDPFDIVWNIEAKYPLEHLEKLRSILNHFKKYAYIDQRATDEHIVLTIFTFESYGRFIKLMIAVFLQIPVEKINSLSSPDLSSFLHHARSYHPPLGMTHLTYSYPIQEYSADQVNHIKQHLRQVAYQVKKPFIMMSHTDAKALDISCCCLTLDKDLFSEAIADKLSTKHLPSLTQPLTFQPDTPIYTSSASLIQSTFRDWIIRESTPHPQRVFRGWNRKEAELHPELTLFKAIRANAFACTTPKALNQDETSSIASILNQYQARHPHQAHALTIQRVFRGFSLRQRLKKTTSSTITHQKHRTFKRLQFMIWKLHQNMMRSACIWSSIGLTGLLGVELFCHMSLNDITLNLLDLINVHLTHIAEPYTILLLAGYLVLSMIIGVCLSAILSPILKPRQFLNENILNPSKPSAANNLNPIAKPSSTLEHTSAYSESNSSASACTMNP